MKLKTIVFLTALSILGALFFCNGPESYSKDLYVSQIIDGDTIELSGGERVRYIGIDTPETREKDASGWSYNPMPYAEEAKEFNRKLAEGKRVRLEFDVRKKDKYNRLLAYVYVEDKMVNLELVKQGLAMIYTYPPNVKYSEDFLEAQENARKNERGLWKGLEDKAISSSEAKDYTGHLRMVEAEILDTYITEKVLILNCRNKFKVVIFANNFSILPKKAVRSPDSFFKNKTIKVYGFIKDYKGVSEIILHDISQLKIL